MCTTILYTTILCHVICNKLNNNQIINLSCSIFIDSILLCYPFLPRQHQGNKLQRRSDVIIIICMIIGLLEIKLSILYPGLCILDLFVYPLFKYYESTHKRISHKKKYYFIKMSTPNNFKKTSINKVYVNPSKYSLLIIIKRVIFAK